MVELITRLLDWYQSNNLVALKWVEHFVKWCELYLMSGMIKCSLVEECQVALNGFTSPPDLLIILMWAPNLGEYLHQQSLLRNYSTFAYYLSLSYSQVVKDAFREFLGLTASKLPLELKLRLNKTLSQIYFFSSLARLRYQASKTCLVD